MSKIALYILDKDIEYLKSLEEYFISSEFNNFNIRTFDSLIKFKNFIEGTTKPPDILLSNETLITDEIMSMKCEKAVLLDGSNSYSGLPYINKYSAGFEISRFILEILSQNTVLTINKNNSKTKAIAITSPEGGSGKTLISISLAKYLTSLGKKVLYVPLKHFSSLHLYFPVDSSNSISKALYYLKTKNNLDMKLLSLAKKDPATGIFYYSPAVNPYELTDIESEEFDLFYQTLKNNTDFDFIIYDIQSGVFKEITTFLYDSDILLTLINGNLSSPSKLKDFTKLFKLGKNTTELLNKRFLIFNKMQKNNISEFFKTEDIEFFTDSLSIPNISNNYDVNNFFQLIYRDIELSIGKIINKFLEYGDL